MTGSPSSNEGKLCSACNGRGGMPKLNVQAAKTEWAICEKCGGSGVEGPEEGVYISPIKGMPFNYQYYLKGKIVANMLLIAYPCEAVNPKTNERQRHITVELHRIWTQERHRHKGLMTKLMEKLKDGKAVEALLKMRGFDAKLRFILSNWQDSSEDGRGFLTKEGFEHVKNVLVWDRKAKSHDLWERGH